MIRIFLPILLLFFVQSKAQTTTPAAQTSIMEGLQIDSPAVFLAWRSTTSPLSGYANVKISGMKNGDTLVQWYTARLFGLPADSMYLHFLRKTRVQRPGLHRIFMYFDQKYITQLKAKFEQMLGAPSKLHERGESLLLVWHNQSLNVVISNKKYLKARSDDVGVFIEIPYHS